MPAKQPTTGGRSIGPYLILSARNNVAKPTIKTIGTENKYQIANVKIMSVRVPEVVDINAEKFANTPGTSAAIKKDMMALLVFMVIYTRNRKNCCL